MVFKLISKNNLPVVSSDVLQVLALLRANPHLKENIKRALLSKYMDKTQLIKNIITEL